MSEFVTLFGFLEMLSLIIFLWLISRLVPRKRRFEAEKVCAKTAGEIIN